MNCKVELTQTAVRFYAECLVCEACEQTAQRLMQRGEQEVKMLLLQMKELVRASIVQGQLSFKVQEEPKQEALEQLLAMMKTQPWPKQSPSIETLPKLSTVSSAQTVVSLASSSATQDSTLDKSSSEISTTATEPSANDAASGH